MNFTQYIKEASRTSANLGSLNLDNTHYISGIITEAGECLDCLKKNLAYKKPIDWVNFAEEIGDCAWYLANLFRANNIEFKEDVEYIELYQENFPLLFDIVWCASDIFLYESEINGCNLFTIYSYLRNLCTINSLDFEEILDTNIKKLKARYPEKFTEYDATHRNLETERKILEEGGR